MILNKLYYLSLACLKGCPLLLLHYKYLGGPYLLLEPGFWCPEFVKSVRSTNSRKVIEVYFCQGVLTKTQVQG